MTWKTERAENLSVCDACGKQIGGSIAQYGNPGGEYTQRESLDEPVHFCARAQEHYCDECVRAGNRADWGCGTSPACKDCNIPDLFAAD